MRRIRGFTLVELLVVLLVMGLLLGVVSVATRPDDRGLLKLEAERLVQLLNLAVEESRLGGRPIRWMSDGVDYRFSRLNPAGEWHEIRDNDLFRPRRLPRGVMLSLRVEAPRAPEEMHVVFFPYDPPAPFVIEMSLGAERSRLMSSPLGEVRLLPDAGGSDAG